MVLYLLSLIYGAGVSFRNRLYDGGIVRVRRLPVPVISVGNLSLGGSGKTSLVMFLAERLSEKFRVAVLLRGYRRRSRV
ncbi:MAG: tetraacyldisaccharide 4'-kinase [Aquificota bacterium]|nr:tetraacyldisaccharide 4'-kinase [Aquificota bacterium]